MARRSSSKTGAKRAIKRAAKTKQGRTVIAVLVLALVVVLALEYLGVLSLGIFDRQAPPDPVPNPNPPIMVSDSDFQIHFIELDSYYAGDSIYIRVDNVDILIDAGPKTSTVSTISKYLNTYMKDDVLDYVIVTHAHEDHYAGFATPYGTDSLFDLYQVANIIDFSMTNQTTGKMYQNYLRERDEEIAAGANHMTAAECIQQGKSEIWLNEDVKMTILDSYYYYNKASSENEYSVCLLFSQGANHYLFTGDLEEEGEKHLVEMNNLPEVTLYKAGHHGSKTSSSYALMSVIKPEIVVFTCTAFSPEYTSNNSNTFPTQEVISRIAPYTDRVYVTSVYVPDPTGKNDEGHAPLNGHIVISDDGERVTVQCSHSDTLLKDTTYFAEYRTMPPAWRKS